MRYRVLAGAIGLVAIAIWSACQSDFAGPSLRDTVILRAMVNDTVSCPGGSGTNRCVPPDEQEFFLMSSSVNYISEEPPCDQFKDWLYWAMIYEEIWVDLDTDADGWHSLNGHPGHTYHPHTAFSRSFLATAGTAQMAINMVHEAAHHFGHGEAEAQEFGSSCYLF